MSKIVSDYESSLWNLEFDNKLLLFLSGSSSRGGGAGGRISIMYSVSEFTGSYQAYGGQSKYSTGGAGTIYMLADGKSKLIIDNKTPYNVPVCITL